MTYPPVPPAQPTPHGQPKKRPSTGAIIAIVVVGLAVLCCGGVGIANVAGKDKPAASTAATTAATPGKPAAPSPSAAGHTIRFEVTATAGKATLINWSTLEDSAILNDTPTPWAKTVRLETKTGLVGVNASAKGRVACKLFVDDKLVDEGESDSVVNCSAMVN